MAAYPTLPITLNSRRSFDSGRTAVRATNGALKVRALYSSEKATIELEHELTAAQATSLDSFYGTNKDLDVTFTWPQPVENYTVRFVAKPRHDPQPGGWFKTYVTLLQV